MKYYRVQIAGYGSEMVYGKLTEAQYEFWKDLSESDIISHAFWDPTEESDDNPVFDMEDPRFLGDWNELDNYLHEYGADASGAWVNIEEEDGENNIINTIADGIDWDKFQEEFNPLTTTIDETECLNDAEYTFYGASSEKGTFGDYLIETEQELDLSKLEFGVTETPDGSILELLTYDGQDLDNEGGDTTGKGYYASIWEE